MSNFFKDRDERGAPLEILIANDFHARGIPVGFNPASGTEDPTREDYDLYTGLPGAATFWEVKMDWMSGLTGRTFIEEKTLRNTKASKMIVGRLMLDVFDVQRLREMFDERLQTPVYDERKSIWLMTRYKHVIGGDQADNMGMLLDWRDVKANSRPLWAVTKELKQNAHV